MARGAALDSEDDIFSAGFDDADLDAPSGGEPESILPSQDPPDARLVSEAIRRQVQPGARREPAPQSQQPDTRRPGSPDTSDPTISGLLREIAEERRARRELEQRLLPKAEPEPEVDVAELLFQNPKQVLNDLKAELRSEFAREKLEQDMTRGIERYGEEFNTTFQSFMDTIRATRDQYTYQRVMSQPSPAEAIMQWGRQQQIMQATGGDLAAFEAQIRAKVLEEMGIGSIAPAQDRQAGRGTPRARDEDGRFTSQPPRREIRLPTATSRIPGASSGGSLEAEDGSEEAIFEAGRAPNRRR
jgi:hypothetical protein